MRPGPLLRPRLVAGRQLFGAEGIGEAAAGAARRERLGGMRLAALHPGQLVVPVTEPNRGHFLTFRTPEAGAIYRRLLAANVITDHRGDRLRVGFGLYHDDDDVDRLCGALEEALA